MDGAEYLNLPPSNVLFVPQVIQLIGASRRARPACLEVPTMAQASDTSLSLPKRPSWCNGSATLDGQTDQHHHQKRKRPQCVESEEKWHLTGLPIDEPP
jgi:hypothetical protein